MLTNTKKSYFAKSIAMIMALLMVLSVCLTGCGNQAAEDAASKADAATEAANKAQTAADAVAKALEELRSEVVSLDAINALLKDELSKYAKAEDIPSLVDYVKSADFDALSAKVNELYTKSAIDDKLTAINNTLGGKADKTELNALAGQVTDAGKKIDQLKAAYEKADADQKAALEKQISDAQAALQGKITALENSIKSMATTENIDAINAELATLGQTLTDLGIRLNEVTRPKDGIIATMIREAIAQFSTDLALEEYKGATDERLAKLENLMQAIIEGLFTQAELDKIANMKGDFDLLNTPPVLITEAIRNLMDLDEWDATTPVVIETISGLQKTLEKLYAEDSDGNRVYAYTDAAKKAINDCFAKIGVEIYDLDKDELVDYDEVANDLTIYILRAANMTALDELKAMVEAAEKVEDFATEYNKLLDELLAMPEVVTIEFVDEFNAFNAKYDELIVKYLLDGAFNGTQYHSGAAADKAFGAITLYSLWTKDNTTYAKAVNYAPTTEQDKKDWTSTGKYTIIGELDSVWKAAELHTLSKTDLTFNWTAGQTVLTADCKVDTYNVGSTHLAADADVAIDVYKALYTQLTECRTLIDTANNNFQTFLKDVLVANGYVASKKVALISLTENGDYSKISIADFVDALAPEMCSPLKDEPSYGTPAIYLTGANSVQAAYNAALKRNAWTVDENDYKSEIFMGYFESTKTNVADFELYMELLKKADAVLFEKYQQYAADLLMTIAEDYRSVADYIHNSMDAAYKPDTATDVTSIALNQTYIDGLASKYKIGALTEGFIDSFLNGTAFKGWSVEVVGGGADTFTIKKGETKGSGDAFSTIALVTYYKDNGTAITADGAVIADPYTTINANYLELYTQLMGAVALQGQKLTDLVYDADKFDAANGPWKVFSDYLTAAIRNLDEVYFRFLFEDYKKAAINEVSAHAAYVAPFFTVNNPDGDAAALQSALEHFVTGYDHNGVAAGTTHTANVLLKVDLLNNATVYADLFSADRVIADDKMHGKDFLAEGTQDPADPESLATGMRVLVDAAVATHLNTLDNAAVKYNFAYYVKVATDLLFDSYLNFAETAKKLSNSAMVIDLQARYIEASNTIANIERLNNKGEYELPSYAVYYKELLGLIFAENQEAHLSYLTKDRDETVQVYDEAIAKVLSYVDTTGTANTPDDVDGKGGAYPAAGSLIVIFDKELNAKLYN